MLGGAAVHFALAASFFEEVRVVGPVGEDFGEAEFEVMRHRGVDTSDIERIAGGKTFFWRGEYGWDLNSRETLDTQLGVFESFQPKLSARARKRRAVPRQHRARPADRGARAAARRSLRGTRLDEPVDRHRARAAGARNRRGGLLDPQRRRAAPADGQAEPRIGGARDPRLGAARPEGDRRQAGRVWRRAGDGRQFLRAAGLPTRERDRPDRRRRHVRWWVCRLHRRAPDEELSGELCETTLFARRAMAHGRRARCAILQRRGVRTPSASND